MTQRARTMAVTLAVILAVGASGAAQQAGKKEYHFRGKVERVDAKASKLTVNGEKVEGWMAAMTMDYKVDKPASLAKLKAGDQITAKVYDGNLDTLFGIEVVPPKDSRTPPAR